MTDLTLGVLAFVALFGLMIFRTPVAFAMLIVGYFGMALQEGFRTAGAVLVTWALAIAALMKSRWLTLPTP